MYSYFNGSQKYFSEEYEKNNKLNLINQYYNNDKNDNNENEDSEEENSEESNEKENSSGNE